MFPFTDNTNCLPCISQSQHGSVALLWNQSDINTGLPGCPGQLSLCITTALFIPCMPLRPAGQCHLARPCQTQEWFGLGTADQAAMLWHTNNNYNPYSITWTCHERDFAPSAWCLKRPVVVAHTKI